MTATEAQLLAMLRSRHPEYDYESSMDFIGDGLLDSFDIVMLTSDLEADFGITIPGEMILPENFATIAAMSALVGALSKAG
ncbi:MAG: acyl carrier protein [Roseateles sp.]|uniref:acyl carrier protein n=1 Tax=Roseateles sp. TaxID=1971397 RepID=UPI0039E883AE